METFCTCRPLVVEVRQCVRAETVTTDLGFINVNSGDWIVRGENGESYVVDDAFFQRTFVSTPQQAASCLDSDLQQSSTPPRPGQIANEITRLRFAIRSCRRRLRAR